MAVVQISKIQIRRGQKNAGSGVPQLSSAELAWAVDSQELFIGNGSVQEGAPYVGNTKILTEHDNILELASSYRFASDDPSITLSTSRALLGKIDEIEVSVADFGAVADGSTDNVTAFENAFTELFRNVDPNFKKILKVPNGEYLFASDLDIPSNAIIRGETQTGAVLNFDTNNIRFITANGSALAIFTSSDRPHNVEMSNLTIKRSSGQTRISGLADSLFKNVKFKGEYALGNGVSSLSSEPAAVSWINENGGFKVTNVTFDGCIFENNSVGISCTQTITADTTVIIKNSHFSVLDTAIYINGIIDQGNYWRIFDNTFEEIATQAFRATNGKGTKIQRCDFKNCGNGTNSADSPLTPIVYFNQNIDNLVLNCTSNRQQEAGVVTADTVDNVSEVYGSDLTTLINRNYSDIYLSDSFRPVATFSALNNFMTVNYILRLGSYVRHGNLIMSVGDDLSKISVSDNYQYSDLSASSPGGVIMTNFEFDAQLKDNDSDSGIETIVLYYKNPLATGQTGTLSFDVSYGV